MKILVTIWTTCLLLCPGLPLFLILAQTRFYNFQKHIVHHVFLCASGRTTWSPSTTHLRREREAPPATSPKLLWSSCCKGMSNPARTTRAPLARFTTLWPLTPACCSHPITSITCIQKITSSLGQDSPVNHIPDTPSCRQKLRLL